MSTSVKSICKTEKKDQITGMLSSSKKAYTTYCYLATRDAAETRSAVNTIKNYILVKGK